MARDLADMDDPESFSTISVGEWRLLDRVSEGILRRTVLMSARYACALLHTCDKQSYLTGGEHPHFGLGKGTHVIELNQLRGVALLDAQFGVDALLVLTTEGHVWSLGRGSEGQLGHGDAADSNVLRHIESLRDVEEIAVGGLHCLARTRDGKVYGWGYNAHDQIHPDSHDNLTKPRLISSYNGLSVRSIACGAHYSIIFTEKGKVYEFGSNGDRGSGEVGFPPGTTIKRVHVYKDVNYALSGEGHVFAWGCNGPSALGLGHDNDPVRIPQRLQDFPSPVEDIRTIGKATIVRTRDGPCYHWGIYRGVTNSTPVLVPEGVYPCDVMAQYELTNGWVRLDRAKESRMLKTAIQELRKQKEDNQLAITALRSSLEEKFRQDEENRLTINELQASLEDLKKENEELRRRDEEKRVAICALQSSLEDLKIKMSNIQEFIKDRHADTPCVAENLLDGILRDNAVELQKHFIIDEMFLADMRRQNGLTSTLCEEISVQSTKSKKVVTFCELIGKRGPSALGHFLHSLHHTEQDHVIHLIFQNLRGKYNGLEQLFAVLRKHNSTEVVEDITNLWMNVEDDHLL